MAERKISRRTLVKGTVAGAGAIGAMALSPRHSLAATRRRALPFGRNYDVAVAGGGPGGIGAAVGAAKCGARVLVIERYGFLGGMATAGMVNPFMSWFAGRKQLIAGVFQEMLDRLEKAGGYDPKGRQRGAFDFELFKIVADQIMADNGVDLLFHSFVCDARVDSGRIKRLVAQTKSGPIALRANVFVDATGDADVAFLSGAPCEKGREEDGLVQPLTLNFNVGGVDESRLPKREEIKRLYIEAKKAGRLHNPRENVHTFRTTRPNEIHFNTTRIIKVDATNVREMTRAELEGRRQVWEMLNWLRATVSGFEKCYLLALGTQVGVRETRRIVGDYVMTGDDVLEARKFTDVIAVNNYPVDIHNPAGTGTVIKRLKSGEFYAVPYRTLTPKKIDNLIVGGRPISTTHAAHSSTRVMPISMATGHACGVAAALAASGNGVFRDVAIKELQSELRSQKAILH